MVKKPQLEFDNKLLENFIWSLFNFQLFNIISLAIFL